MVLDILTKSTHLLSRKLRAIWINMPRNTTRKLFESLDISIHCFRLWPKVYIIVLINLHRGLGTSLSFGITFHPQRDCHFEQVVHILEDILRSCTIDFLGSWDAELPLFDFTHNTSYQATIVVAPYEAIYRWKFTSPLNLDEVGETKW